jgi:hypothetical protein
MPEIEREIRIKQHIISERRDVYGFMTGRCDTVLKSFRKEGKSE